MNLHYRQAREVFSIRVSLGFQLELSYGFELRVRIGLPYCNSGPSHTGKSKITIRVPIL